MAPTMWKIHPADRCNVDCFFCSTAAIRGTDEIALPRLLELVGELQQCGTYSVRLAGGGEPLFHRRIAEFLRAVSSSKLRVENLTTNGVLLREEIAALLYRTTDDITISLNTADEASYGNYDEDTGTQLWPGC